MILLTNPETGYEKAHRQAEQIFREVFSARGMNVREGQIRLCHAMLDTLFGRDVALCDAGVGLGKTYAEDRLSEVRPGAWLACGTGKSREGNLGFQSFRQ